MGVIWRKTQGTAGHGNTGDPRNSGCPGLVAPRRSRFPVSAPELRPSGFLCPLRAPVPSPQFPKAQFPPLLRDLLKSSSEVINDICPPALCFYPSIGSACTTQRVLAEPTPGQAPPWVPRGPCQRCGGSVPGADFWLPHRDQGSLEKSSTQAGGGVTYVTHTPTVFQVARMLQGRFLGTLKAQGALCS